MRLSKELTLDQTLRALDGAGFNNRFRIIFGRKKWALVLVHQTDEKAARTDGCGSEEGRPSGGDSSGPLAGQGPPPAREHSDGRDDA